MILENIFSNRITNNWNSLPSESVTTPILNSFKIDLTNVGCNKKLSTIWNLNFLEPAMEVIYTLVLIKLVELCEFTFACTYDVGT